MEKKEAILKAMHMVHDIVFYVSGHMWYPCLSVDTPIDIWLNFEVLKYVICMKNAGLIYLNHSYYTLLSTLDPVPAL